MEGINYFGRANSLPPTNAPVYLINIIVIAIVIVIVTDSPVHLIL